MLEKQKKDLETATQKDEAKKKIAEAKENEAKAAAEAKLLSEDFVMPKPKLRLIKKLRRKKKLPKKLLC